MTSQGNARPPRRGPGAIRWLFVGIAALILFLFVALDLLPRLMGGLLGRGGDSPGGWAEDAWEMPHIVWDPGDPEPDAEPAETEADADAAPVEADAAAASPTDEAEAEAVPEADAAAGAPPTDAAAAPAAGDPGALAGGAPPGDGAAAGEGRRSPRVIYQEWPQQALLEELSRRGLSGRYRFRLRVEADGRVSEWELLETFDCEPCLAEAERIVRSLQFIPGRLGGRAVACWVPYQIEFTGGRR